MSAQEKTEIKTNATISQLFQIVIELNQEQQKEVLDHAEQLLVKDKRENIRRSCDISVNYAANDRVYANQITNISARSVYRNPASFEHGRRGDTGF